MTTPANWILENNTLRIQRDGLAVTPAALDVLRCIEDGQSVWPDVPPGKTGAASSLKFSAYPIMLRLVVEHDPSVGTLCIRLAGKSRGRDIALPERLADADHVVSGDTWYAIDNESLLEVTDVLRVSGATLGPLRSLGIFLKLRRASQEGTAVEDRTRDAELPPLLFVPPRGDAPRGVHASLYGYQDDGWRWLKFMASQHMGGILADEMGLGKTLQIISLLRDPGEQQTTTPALIVAPGSLLENWKREFAKFAPDLSVLKHHGPRRTGRHAELTRHDVVVTSYDAVVRDGGMFGMVEWPVVVLDEAQHIRNPDAVRTRAAKALRRLTAIAVTGTPLENRLSDLWSLIDFAIPGLLGSLGEFTRTFDESVEAAAALEGLVSPIILRRRVRDVANDLPERIDIPQAIELSQDEAEAYERMRIEIFDAHGKAASLVALTKLRMFCAHPAIAGGHAAAGEFSKLERLRELIEEIFASGQKVIIFTSYTEMADIIVELISRHWGVFAACLDGRLPIDDRQPLIDRFS
ncbi:DEAD/DEAH box helicase, partial [Rhodopseudomonas sp.]|uniref:DEAD/DEAH box helicase n=1 Tax=Rhodopseudomonas sp. TaxID=1078 RepID=UPI003B3B3779